MDYLDLVYDNLKQTQISVFDEVRVLITRAHDIHNGKKCRISEVEDRGPIVIAHLELASGVIEPNIYETDESQLLMTGKSNDEE